MLRRAVTLAFILLAGTALAGTALPSGPFQGVELDTLPPSQREIITQVTQGAFPGRRIPSVTSFPAVQFNKAYPSRHAHSLRTP